MTWSFSVGQELISALREKKTNNESQLFLNTISDYCALKLRPLHPRSRWSSCSVFPRQLLLKLNLIVFYLALFQMSASTHSVSVSLSSFTGQQDRAGARIVVGADHQHQWSHPVWRRHVHLLPVHHACENSQGLPDCSWWVTAVFFVP